MESKARREKQIAREKEFKNTTTPLLGVVMLFDVWRNETSGERKIVETIRSYKLPYMLALDTYANTANPASQLLVFRDDAEYEEVSAELAEDIIDPEWLRNLFNQI